MDRIPLDKLVALLIVGGVALIVLGVVGTVGATWLAAGASLVGVPGVTDWTGAPIWLSGVGAVLAVAGAALGLREGYRPDHRAPIVRLEASSVVSILLQTKDGRPVFELEHAEPDDVDCYVRVLHRDGRRVEYRTDPALSQAIGEGAYGAVTAQGRWLLAFEPQPRPAEFDRA